MTARRRFLIAGYYGFGNLGDDILALVTAREIAARHPGAVITFLARRPLEIPGVAANYADRSRPLAILRAIKDHDALVLGGGGLFQDRTSFQSTWYYISLIQAAKVLRKPVIGLGLAADTVRSALLRGAVRFSLRGGVRVAFRDEESFSNLRLNRNAAERTGDLALLLPEGHPGPAPADPNRATLIPRFPCTPAMAELFRRTVVSLEASGLMADIVLFQPEKEAPWASKTFGRSFSAEARRIPETLAVCAEFLKGRVVLSARFHGLILAAACGRAPVGLGDPEKAGRLCTRAGWPFLAHAAEAERWIASWGEHRFSALEGFLGAAKQDASRNRDLLAI